MKAAPSAPGNTTSWSPGELVRWRRTDPVPDAIDRRTPLTPDDGSQPNVLLIVADQHRYDCVGAAGGYPVQTPNLDALASAGTFYTSAFTPIPLCVPARQALLTGARPESFGALWNYDLGPLVTALAPDAYSWPRELQRKGYRTHYLGKWHVNPDHGPTDFGYDSYVSLQDYEDWRRAKYPAERVPDGWFGAVDPIPVEASRTHWFARQASSFLEEAGRTGRPWHLRVDFVEPHLPCTPCAQFAERYPPQLIPPWPSVADPLAGKPYIQRQQRVTWGVQDFTWQDWAPVVARYYAVISQLDDAVGRILASLASTGQQDRTVVVYTSDHGDMCGAHGMIDKHYVMYDDVVRVPLIIRWPGRSPAPARTDDFVVNALDLPATIATLAGVSTPPSGHGKILGFESTGAQQSPISPPRNHVVATYNGQQFGLYSQRMIRTRDWKYIWNATDVDELYDLRSDPAEMVNLIEDPSNRELLGELRSALHAELVEHGDRLVDNAWLRHQLLAGAKLDL